MLALLVFNVFCKDCVIWLDKFAFLRTLKKDFFNVVFLIWFVGPCSMRQVYTVESVEFFCVRLKLKITRVAAHSYWNVFLFRVIIIGGPKIIKV